MNTFSIPFPYLCESLLSQDEEEEEVDKSIPNE